MSADLARALVASLDDDALDELAARLAPRLAHPSRTGVADLPVGVAGAAELAGVSGRTIRRALTSGQLDGQQVCGRWQTSPEALEAWSAAGGRTTSTSTPTRGRAHRTTTRNRPSTAAEAILGITPRRTP